MTKKVFIGNLAVGGGESVKIQSMTTEKTAEVDAAVRQILRLQEAGCEIVRVAVLDEADAFAIRKIKEKISIPLVADIHFSPDLAIKSIENGADKIRVNPGNIGGERALERVASAVKLHNIPVRVGANTGNIEPNF
ncbi:MAG: flavodoxin-dependent (E)-4-hydroxy-3-methylbut-2-enyl-diphosphate synthase [Clostridia bacterium]|nr:flavodoxin-dependent (E)-4-hydroxy-3-methylbut-2-enyl-diphosphate synthase [Clostridia bacterium]